MKWHLQERGGNSACFVTPSFLSFWPSKNLSSSTWEWSHLWCSPTTQLGECSLFRWYEMIFGTAWWWFGLERRQQQEIDWGKLDSTFCSSLCECLTRTTSICLTNILLHRMRVAGGLLDGALGWEKAKQWKKKVGFCFIFSMCELATRTSSPTHHYINFPTKNSHHTIICFIPTLFWCTIISDEVRKVMRKTWSVSAWLLWRMCVTYTLPTLPSHHSKWLHLNYCSTITCSSVTHLWLWVEKWTMFGSSLLLLSELALQQNECSFTISGQPAPDLNKVLNTMLWCVDKAICSIVGCIEIRPWGVVDEIAKRDWWPLLQVVKIVVVPSYTVILVLVVQFITILKV